MYQNNRIFVPLLYYLNNLGNVGARQLVFKITRIEHFEANQLCYELPYPYLFFALGNLGNARLGRGPKSGKRGGFAAINFKISLTPRSNWVSLALA